MNQKQLYEKHMADKLEKLKLPTTASDDWPQMKALLDRDMPQGGARRRWWMYGIIAGIILIGGGFGLSYYSQNNQQIQLSNTEEQASPRTQSETPAVASTNRDVTQNETHKTAGNDLAPPVASSEVPVNTGTEKTNISTQRSNDEEKSTQDKLKNENGDDNEPKNIVAKNCIQVGS